MMLAGCTLGSEPVDSRPEALEFIEATLNYDGLRSDSLCQFGGERPCFAPVRTSPHFLKSNEDAAAHMLNPGKFNAAGQYTSVSWPYEASVNKPADVLRIVCRVEGDEVYGYEVERASTVWDAVVVPSEISKSGQDEVGYVPERWMQLAAGLMIDECSTEENPANAPLAQLATKSKY